MNLQNLPLKDLVISQPKAVLVLEKYGLDFCCNGKRTLADACKSKGLDALAIETDINNLINSSSNGTQAASEVQLDELINDIISNHHQYVKEMMPVISQHTSKVARVHGQEHPEVVEVSKIFEQVKEELSHHMMKEEQILFPYIKTLVESKRQDVKRSTSPFHDITNPIRMMENEHEFAGQGLAAIRELSNNFQPPAEACTTYKVAFMELESFMKDLHIHVHKENNILFPKAIALEKEVVGEEAPSCEF